MKKIGCVTLLAFLVLLSSESALAIVNSTTLIEKAKEYDNRMITYQGEIIGDIMKRGDHMWINLYDGSNTIGVWLKAQQGRSMITGSYQAKGDLLQVKGVFHRSCPEHGGDLDIHAQSFKIIRRGHKIAQPIRWKRLLMAGFFIGIAGCLLFTQQRRNR